MTLIMFDKKQIAPKLTALFSKSLAGSLWGFHLCKREGGGLELVFEFQPNGYLSIPLASEEARTLGNILWLVLQEGRVPFSHRRETKDDLRKAFGRWAFSLASLARESKVDDPNEMLIALRELVLLFEMIHGCSLWEEVEPPAVANDTSKAVPHRREAPDPDSDKFFDPDVDEPTTAGEALQTLATFANTAPIKLPARVERALELAREVSAATVVHTPIDPWVVRALEGAPEWDPQIDLRLGTSLRPQTRGEVWFAEVELDVCEDSEGSDQRAAAFVRFLGGLRRRHLRDAFYAHRALRVRPLPRKRS